MSSYMATIESAVEATAILPPASFSWFGKLGPSLDWRIRKTVDRAALRHYLLRAVRDCLYTNFYCLGSASPSDIRAPRADTFPLTNVLSGANAGQGFWDAGWTVASGAESILRVRKNGVTLTIHASDFRAVGEGNAGTGSGGSVRFPKELPSISPGFYMAVSNQSCEHVDWTPLLRLYFNVRARGAIELTRAITTRLNRAAIQFRFKTLSAAPFSGRCDAAVLYFSRRDYDAVAGIVQEIHTELAGELLPRTPVFTKRLADGVGLAEDPPGGASFGATRCTVLAEAMIAARERGLRSPRQRLQAVAEAFEAAGTSLDRPYLNPGSEDCYEPLRSTRAPTTSTPTRNGLKESTAPALDPKRCLEIAHQIGHRLLRDAIWHGGLCTWVGPAGANEAGVYQSLGPELYQGTAGVALFLNELSSATDDDNMARTARAAIQQALRKAADTPPAEKLGLFTGWTGIAYAAIRVALAQQDEQLLSRAQALLKQLWRVRDSAGQLDLMAGRAGAILALLSLGRDLHDPFLAEFATRMGDDLLDQAMAQEGMLSWRTFNSARQCNLTGLSHGTAGIGHALLELFAATGEDRFRDGAEGSFSYEQSWYNSAAGNWPDLREAPRRTSRKSRSLPYATFWCHGAAGIALSRLRAYEVLGNSSYKEQSLRALETTRAWLSAMLTNGGGSFSLCHGLAGNAEILCHGSEMLGSQHGEYRQLALRAARLGADRYLQPGEDWPCSTPAGTSPGLMLGLAGIGYFYLRLSNPQVPSVLLLPLNKPADASRRNRAVRAVAAADCNAPVHREDSYARNCHAV